ncbi:unnamed protein product [Mytilus edulis]|uniref:Fucolectin tachylectin-4 pentraxin-1 domain-containing protein n=1 Tax=Mytilus edulis TaxID=6550 RepID=A0A8S3QSH4_MYTED|nr:unnamed protein product [Mytilus edulis]
MSLLWCTEITLLLFIGECCNANQDCNITSICDMLCYTIGPAYDCKSRGLTEVPSFPETTIVLKLGENDLAILPENLFETYIALLEMQVSYYCIKNVNGFCNVAYRRQASQSTTYIDQPQRSGYSCNGVDGLESTDFYTGSCVHTMIESSPWWQVDLGAVYTVEFINISARTDFPGYFHYKKFSNIQITVDGLSCAYYAGPPALSEIYEPITITCAASATGRYLKIERQVSGNLQFCEVRVFVFILQTDLEIKCYSRSIVSVTNLASSRIERLQTYSWTAN